MAAVQRAHRKEITLLGVLFLEEENPANIISVLATREKLGLMIGSALAKQAAVVNTSKPADALFTADRRIVIAKICENL